MAKKIRITPTALRDIQDGVDYYNQKQKGLGKRFAEEAKKTFEKILDMPQAASIAYDDIRYKVIDKFPFIVIYNFGETHIDIYRVFNTHLNPQSL